ncbi:hypothetical protein [Cribrihabitans pelagius]|uniref:hypothetical protein n=1 Tax=Cribrihabitans pelagius TaxID=1765746 RepID=UPI003B5CB06A
MSQDLIFARHAAIITVISMQLIVVNDPLQYDAWDAAISFLCLIFAIETFKLGHSDFYERVLISANMGVSGSFSIFYSASYLFYFALSVFDTREIFPQWLTNEPFAEVVFAFDFPGRYWDDFTLGELAVPILSLIAFLKVRHRRS